jgi:hypothetical protein
VLIENLTFRLASGVDEADFLEADRKVQTELVPNLTGFIRRTTARGSDGEWLVVTLWASAAEADAAPPATDFMALVDPASVSVQRYSTLD